MIEVTVSLVLGLIILSALTPVMRLALDSGAQARDVTELAYKGQFALERMVDRARATTPKVLAAPTAGTTGTWFAPAGCAGAACVMYCRNSSNNTLVETVSSDNTCAGSAIIATQVTAFSATLPTMGPLDRHSVVLSLTVSDNNGHSITLNTQVRLGGGTL